jgi:hypothetical protein
LHTKLILLDPARPQVPKFSVFEGLALLELGLKVGDGLRELQALELLYLLLFLEHQDAGLDLSLA